MATAIAAAEAVKYFKGKNSVQVQTAKPVKVKGDDGKVRDAFDVKSVPLSEEHVLSATDLGDKVKIVTIDGQRYEAAKGKDA